MGNQKSLMTSPCNPLYEHPSVLKKITNQFRTEGFIVLENALDNSFLQLLIPELSNINWRKQESIGNHSYSIPHTAAGFVKYLLAFLASPEWLIWMENGTGQSVTLNSIAIRRFSHADYTLQHEVQQEGTYLALDLQTLSHDAGGFTSVIKDGTELLKINPRKNQMVIWNQRMGIRSFVKYANHHV